MQVSERSIACSFAASTLLRPTPLPQVAPEPRDDPRITIAAIVERLVDLLGVQDQRISFRKALNFAANTSACDTGTSSSSAP